MIRSPHLPTFFYDEEPMTEPEGNPSPRMKDDVWSAYEQQSISKKQATQLRSDSQLLEMIIQSLQLSLADLKLS